MPLTRVILMAAKRPEDLLLPLQQTTAFERMSMFPERRFAKKIRPGSWRDEDFVTALVDEIALSLATSPDFFFGRDARDANAGRSEFGPYHPQPFALTLNLRSMTRLKNLSLLLLASAIPAVLSSQAPAAKPGYPVPPRSLGETEEIALAMTAAPEEISAKADVYVLRGTEFVKARAGTNGCSCMVGRDSHEGSRYPICFDQEATRTTLLREIKQASLRAKGTSEEDIDRIVAEAYKSGELRMPSKPAMAYMMSPQQVLFSSPLARGVRVGAWYPHLMLMMPDVAPEQLGLAEQSKVDIIQIHREGDHHAELIVKVPAWSDGKPAVRPASPGKSD